VFGSFGDWPTPFGGTFVGGTNRGVGGGPKSGLFRGDGGRTGFGGNNGSTSFRPFGPGGYSVAARAGYGDKGTGTARWGGCCCGGAFGSCGFCGVVAVGSFGRAGELGLPGFVGFGLVGFGLVGFGLVGFGFLGSAPLGFVGLPVADGLVGSVGFVGFDGSGCPFGRRGCGCVAGCALSGRVGFTPFGYVGLGGTLPMGGGGTGRTPDGTNGFSFGR
jgi:hypothetical protein